MLFFINFRYGMDTSFSVIRVLAKIAGLSPLDKEVTTEFFSSPHKCPFTLTQDCHGNHPVVATSLSDFVKSVERKVSVGGIKWSGSERQLLPTADSATFTLQGGHTERVQWSYTVLRGSDTLSQQVCMAYKLILQLDASSRLAKHVSTSLRSTQDIILYLPLLCV